jgi:hypothetical protein
LIVRAKVRKKDDKMPEKPKKFLETLAPGCNTTQCLVGLFVTAKGGEAYITLAGRTESYTWGTYHVSTIEQVLEELP